MSDFIFYYRHGLIKCQSWFLKLSHQYVSYLMIEEFIFLLLFPDICGLLYERKSFDLGHEYHGYHTSVVNECGHIKGCYKLVLCNS